MQDGQEPRREEARTDHGKAVESPTGSPQGERHSRLLAPPGHQMGLALHPRCRQRGLRDP
eukprot:13815959-Heterocapsa_arctica.AAC.1